MNKFFDINFSKNSFTISSFPFLLVFISPSFLSFPFKQSINFIILSISVCSSNLFENSKNIKSFISLKSIFSYSSSILDFRFFSLSSSSSSSSLSLSSLYSLLNNIFIISMNIKELIFLFNFLSVSLTLLFIKSNFLSFSNLFRFASKFFSFVSLSFLFFDSSKAAT